MKTTICLRPADCGVGWLAAPGTRSRVLACEPSGALVQELGGALVEVRWRPPRCRIRIRSGQAEPDRQARNADLLVCTGAELEVGWLPVLLQQSGNAKIQPGQPGNFAAADFVRKLDVPTQVDRSQGDVHAAGNPHIQTDPRNIALVATALTERLQQLDASNASAYADRAKDFQQRWQQAMARWTAKAAGLKGMAVVSQHKAFTYLYDWLGMKEVAVLEPKPGVEPSVSHLQQVLASLKTQPARIVIYAAYQDGRPSDWLQRNSGIATVRLPFTVGGSDGAKDLFGLFDDTIDRLTTATGTAK
jgi:zinc/manganese transport system substrate-binding protein